MTALRSSPPRLLRLNSVFVEFSLALCHAPPGTITTTPAPQTAVAFIHGCDCLAPPPSPVGYQMTLSPNPAEPRTAFGLQMAVHLPACRGPLSRSSPVCREPGSCDIGFRDPPHPICCATREVGNTPVCFSSRFLLNPSGFSFTPQGVFVAMKVGCVLF